MNHRLLTIALLGGCLATTWPAHAAVVWNQGDYLTDTSGGTATGTLLMSDFVLAAPTNITNFTVWMRDAAPGPLGGNGVANGVFGTFSGALSWYVFLEAGGLPGALLASGNTVPLVVDTGVDTVGASPEDIFAVSAALGAPLLAPAGHYWFGIREGNVGDAQDDSYTIWLKSGTLTGLDGYYWGNGANQTNLFGPNSIDHAFVLEGNAASVPEPSAPALLVVALFAAGIARKRLS